MVKTVVVNSSNYTSANTFVYNFRSELKCPDDIAAVAVSNISFYNSTFNISSSLYNNNVITLNWLGTIYTITFPNSYMASADINAYLQYFCYTNNLYMTSSSSQIIYFIECVTNSPRYALSLNLYAIPTTSQASTLGYSMPSGATWSLPGTASTPQLTITSGFGSLIGLSAGTYPVAVQSTNQQFVSTTTPIISPVNAYVFTISLINNPYTNPLNNIICEVPLNASFGNLVNFIPPNLVWHDIYQGKYANMQINLYDQNFNPLSFNDNEFVINLAFASSKELNQIKNK